ncbi:MAG: hypothetical protein ACETWT_00045 [Thermodesulfobacteriota bacterium]
MSEYRVKFPNHPLEKIKELVKARGMDGYHIQRISALFRLGR